MDRYERAVELGGAARRLCEEAAAREARVRRSPTPNGKVTCYTRGEGKHPAPTTAGAWCTRYALAVDLPAVADAQEYIFDVGTEPVRNYMDERGIEL